MIKKVILGIVIAVGGFVLLIFLLLFVYAFYSVKANEKVDVAAKNFCNSIRTGANIDTVIKAAEKNSHRNHLYANEDVYRFTFPGELFHASACTVKTKDGKVVSAELQVFDD